MGTFASLPESVSDEPAALRDDVLAGRLRRTRRGAYHPVEPTAGTAIDAQRDARRRIAALAAQLTSRCGSATSLRR